MVPLIRQVMRVIEIMRHVTQWLQSTHSLVLNKTKHSCSVVRLLGFGDSISYLHRPGLLSDLLDGHHQGLDSGNSTSMEHLKATLDHLEEDGHVTCGLLSSLEAQEYLGKHHAMSRTHHNHYASSSLFGRTCPLQPEVLIDLSDSVYPLYAYTALHYWPLHGSGVLLGGDQGWLLLATEDHNGDTVRKRNQVILRGVKVRPKTIIKQKQKKKKTLNPKSIVILLSSVGVNC
ncbi:unnamed protein product [Spirodela intermedia]|uniref:Uncharacterized protein n=1 Tax=Spirodela intermedia TaxID=51605 RepID=A0A7I8JH65_SPIIN|nr:unnamed protein product [Spirodela intermedia]CAA6669474.1 unnamed protein product [Spirodela intermedia]